MAGTLTVTFTGNESVVVFDDLTLLYYWWSKILLPIANYSDH
jgi:hypothetical protein